MYIAAVSEWRHHIYHEVINFIYSSEHNKPRLTLARQYYYIYPSINLRRLTHVGQARNTNRASTSASVVGLNKGYVDWLAISTRYCLIHKLLAMALDEAEGIQRTYPTILVITASRLRAAHYPRWTLRKRFLSHQGLTLFLTEYSCQGRTMMSQDICPSVSSYARFALARQFRTLALFYVW